MFKKKSQPRGTPENPIAEEKRKVKHGKIRNIIDDGRAHSWFVTVHQAGGKAEDRSSFIVFTLEPDMSVRVVMETHGNLFTELNFLRAVQDMATELLDDVIDHTVEVEKKRAVK